MSEPKLASLLDLENKGLPYKVFIHDGPVESLEQAALERNQIPDQIIRSLLFRLSEEDFALILVAGSAQIPWKKLREFFDRRRLTMASREEVKAQTGYVIGAVSPFGLANELPVYIDESVLKNEIVSIGSGKRGTAIIINSAELKNAFPQARLVNLFT